MRIRTQTQLFIGIAFLIVLAMSIIYWLNQAKMDEIAVVEERSLAAASKVASLQSLTHEYFVYSEARVAQQWLSQQTALADLMQNGASSHLSIDSESLIKVNELTDLFQRLKVASSNDTSFNTRQKEFLAQQLLITTEIVSDAINRWASEVREARISLERGFKPLTLAIPLLMLVILLLLGFLLNHRVLLPLQNLHRVVVAVSKGDLSLRSDYRSNDELGDLSRTFDAMAVDLVTELRKEITDRKQAERVLSESEARFRLLVENAPDAVFVRDRECFTYINNAALTLFGADSAEELLGTPIIDRYHPISRDSIRARMEIVNEQHQSVPLHQSICLKLDGSEVNVESSAVPITYMETGRSLFFMRDITDRLEEQTHRQQLEEQLHHSQKIESIGRLAGGVAHDYNNMLSVIIGNAELAKMKTEQAAPINDNLGQILQAANRSKDITRQLLAFARKQIINPKVLDLNVVVENMLKMLRNLLGENIDLRWQPKGSLWQVKIDSSQLDQVLANLCINARDAITESGKLTIETDTVSLDEDYCKDHQGFFCGDYVVLSVTDNGCGMDKETLDNIFEPFFTTKQRGEGTGLGMATVYGIVKQNGGFINVYSEPNHGTTFKIYFSRHEGEDVISQEITVSDIQMGQGETVLLVEDEITIVELATAMLEDLGYRVLPTNSPVEALNLLQEHQGDIHLLLTDVVMPGMNGRELSRQLRESHPEMKTLFMSGYTANVIAHHGVLDDGISFLQKPFSRHDLM